MEELGNRGGYTSKKRGKNILRSYNLLIAGEKAAFMGHCEKRRLFLSDQGRGVLFGRTEEDPTLNWGGKNL